MVRFDFVVGSNMQLYLMEANMSPNLSSKHFALNRWWPNLSSMHFALKG